MTTVKLSMPIGLQLEMARTGCLSNDHLLEICKSKDIHALKHLNQDAEDWKMLFQFAEEHWEEFQEAVQVGYKFKFVTRNGLKHFMIYRYGLEEGTDFECGETYFDQIKLKADQVCELERMITQNWRIKRLTAENNGLELIRIERSAQ